LAWADGDWGQEEVILTIILSVASSAPVQFPAYDTASYCETLDQSKLEAVRQHAIGCLTREQFEKAEAEKKFQREERRYVQEICIERAELANGSYSALSFCLDASKSKLRGDKTLPKVHNQQADQ
jgi:hypothetical protein